MPMFWVMYHAVGEGGDITVNHGVCFLTVDPLVYVSYQMCPSPWVVLGCLTNCN